MNPINLKTEFGDKWQIGLDEAANGRSVGRPPSDFAIGNLL